LTGCFQLNEITFICKGEIPIYTYTPDLDCEATLLHPSTTRIPDDCDYSFFKLSRTFRIPLHKSNKWLFVTPQVETFTVLCPQETITLKLKNEDKLTLKPECKGYSSYVTLYTMSTVYTNVTNDYVPSAPIDFDCCFEDLKQINLEELPLHMPLVNTVSPMDDLRLASKKTEEVQQLIREQEGKQNQNFLKAATPSTTILTIICVIIVCICRSCCCKCCRNCFFWLWKRWNPRDCWQQTKDKRCVNIYNYNGSQVEYRKTHTSPAISIKSLPDLETTTGSREAKLSKSDSNLNIVLKKIKNRRMFR
jgi:hypothetical protein